MNQPIDIHPGVTWNQEPPNVKDKLPPANAGIKPRKKLCPRYYHSCFKTECQETKKCEE